MQGSSGFTIPILMKICFVSASDYEICPDWPHLVLLSASEPIWWSWNFLSPAKLFSINLSFPGRVFVANRGRLFSIFLAVVFCHRFSVWLSIRSGLVPSSCLLECRLITADVLFQYYKTASFLTKTKIKYWDIEKYWKMSRSYFDGI